MIVLSVNKYATPLWGRATGKIRIARTARFWSNGTDRVTEDIYLMDIRIKLLREVPGDIRANRI